MKLVICFAIMLGSIPAVAAPPVAMTAVHGPPRAATKRLESGVKHALKESGIELVDPTAADYLLEVSVTIAKKKFRAEALITSTRDGSAIWNAQRTYANKRAAWKIGRTLGWLSGEKLKELKSEVKPIVPVVAEPIAPAIVETIDAPPPPEPEPTSKHPDDRLFRGTLYAGSQLTGEYAVSVGATATGLSYRLRPTALLSGELLVNFPWLPLSAELAIAYVPMTYDIQVAPAVTPDDPSARHIDVSGSIGYGFSWWRLTFRPLVGLTYRSLSVEKQEPINVLVGSKSVAPHLGLRAGVRIGDAVVELNGLFRLVASYRESPDTTGGKGLGYSALVGGTFRYWIFDFFGAYADVHYDFTRVGFDGEGTRVKFADDPVLMNATIRAAEVRAALGVTFAI